MLQKSRSESISKLKFFLLSLGLLILPHVSLAQIINKSEQESQKLTIEVQNLHNLNIKEQEIVKLAIEGLKTDSLYREIIVKDGSELVGFFNNTKGKHAIFVSNLPGRPKLPERTSKDKIVKSTTYWPGCEGLADDELITCNSLKIAELVNKRYDFNFDAIKFVLNN